MSETRSPLLMQFHAATKIRGEVGSKLTLEKYVSRHNNADLSKLAAQVNPLIFAKYARAHANDVAVPFDRFLSERCCHIDDALLTADYQKAISDPERKAAINAWISQFRTAEKLTALPSSQASAPVKVQRKDMFAELQASNESAPVKPEDNFLSFYAQVATKKDTVQTPLKAKDIVTEPSKKSNIVIEPQRKVADTKTNTKTNTKTVAKAERVDPIQASVALLKEKKYNQVPRQHLNAVVRHLQQHGIGTVETLELFNKAVDLSHNGVDCCDADQICDAVKLFHEHNIDNLPKREKRALVDFLERGSPETLKEVQEREPKAFEHLLNNKAKLQAAADSDILISAQKISDIVSANRPASEKQTYVIAHNDVPVVRFLLSSNAESKLDSYLQSLRLKEGSNNGIRQFANIDGLTWDPKLSNSKPFVSSNGKVTIYASAPFADRTSFFDSWIKASGIEIKANSVFLAPTDEAIISTGMLNKWKQMTAEQQQKWLLSHQVKSNAAFASSVRKIASGEGSWVTQYKTVYGRDVSAVLQTKVVHDTKLNATLVPIGRILA